MKAKFIIRRIVSCGLILGVLSGCKYYEMKSFNPQVSTKQKRKLSNQIWVTRGGHYMLYVGDEIWEVDNYKRKKDVITGTLIPTNPVVMSTFEQAKAAANYRGRGRKTNSQYKSEWTQIHLYADSVLIQESKEDGFSSVQFTINDINKAKSLRYNERANFMSGFGFTAGGLGIGMGILIAIECSCPHAYTFDGESYHFTNTLFTGATAANLERNDYKILQDYRPDSDSYEMIIKNEENESHYTNLLELIVVNHDANIEVIPDQNGNIHSVSKLETAMSLVDDNGNDLSNLVSFRDDVAYSFDNDSDENMISTIATFTRPEDVSNAKVVVKLKNSEWGGVVYKTFASMMGNKYDDWVEKNHERTPEEAEEGMKKAGVPMTVSIKKDGEWIEIESISLVGEASYNTLAIPVDESLISDENIEVRLQAGFKFWDLDFVGMDFSQNADLDVETVNSSVTALNQDDDLYLEHILTGDSTYIKFEGLKTTGEKRTIIMRSKGYYISNDEYSGTPYWKELMKLRGQGGLSKLSKKIYREYSKQYAVN